jgi:hypothetical protein
MSRAMNLNVTEAYVVQLCKDLDIEISTIEKLESDGVRLVCASAGGAALLRYKLEDKLINGLVKRSRVFAGGMQPYRSAKPEVHDAGLMQPPRPGTGPWRR